MKSDDGLVRRTLLPGGLRVITEQMPGIRSASVGVWVGVGSADETPKQHGCSHFLEHLLFKGTGERSAMDISASLDAVGGEFNAFTAKEYTCFHARVLDDDLPMTIDVLGDMVTSSTLAAEDVEAERDVILDEIAMHDDDPDDVVHNLFAEQAWGSAPIARNIAGTHASVETMPRGQVVRFYKRHYRAANTSSRRPETSSIRPSYARSRSRSGATASWPRTRSRSLPRQLTGCVACTPGWPPRRDRSSRST